MVVFKLVGVTLFSFFFFTTPRQLGEEHVDYCRRHVADITIDGRDKISAHELVI